MSVPVCSYWPRATGLGAVSWILTTSHHMPVTSTRLHCLAQAHAPQPHAAPPMLASSRIDMRSRSFSHRATFCKQAEQHLCTQHEER